MIFGFDQFMSHVIEPPAESLAKTRFYEKNSVKLITMTGIGKQSMEILSLERSDKSTAYKKIVWKRGCQ